MSEAEIKSEWPRHGFHFYEMESPLNGFYVECAYRFTDGTVCHRLRDDPCHSQPIKPVKVKEAGPNATKQV